MLPKAESAPSARASFTSWGSMALTLVASPWNFIYDALRFWCNLAWVGHISQDYLDYIGWPRNVTRQMKVWRNSKRTQLNKENLSLVAYFLFVVRSASFRLQMLVFLYQIKVQRAVWVQILKLQKLLQKSCKRGAAQRLLQLRFSACTWSRRGPLSIYLFFNVVLLDMNFFLKSII